MPPSCDSILPPHVPYTFLSLTIGLWGVDPCKAKEIDALRAQMAQLQTANAATRCLATLQFGLPAINNLLPGEGLQGALHAAAGGGTETGHCAGPRSRRFAAGACDLPSGWPACAGRDGRRLEIHWPGLRCCRDHCARHAYPCQQAHRVCDVNPVRPR
jgi:hypothetical protein